MLSVVYLSGVRGLGLAEEGEAGQRSLGPVKIPFSLFSGHYVMARRMARTWGQIWVVSGSVCTVSYGS